MLETLFDVIVERKQNMPAGSYTAQLFEGGESRILRKVGEEALEVIFAAQGEGDERLVEESADLLYHLLVLLVARGLTLEQLYDELARRRKGSA